MAGLAVQLRELGAEVRVCAPPDEDFARLLAGVGVPLVPVGRSARALTTAAPPPSSLPEHAAELIAAQFHTVTAAAEGCDVLLATGMFPAAAGALSVAENWASGPCTRASRRGSCRLRTTRRWRIQVGRSRRR
ncbi:hypothetical protein [Streptomyces purpurascens]